MVDINTNTLEHIHDHHKRWVGKSGLFSILGAVSMDVSSLRISLHIQAVDTPKQRLKLDLYDYTQIVRHTTTLSEEHGFNYADLEKDFLSLTECLELYREEILLSVYTDTSTKKQQKLSLTNEKKYIEVLIQDNLLDYLGTELGKIGIAGEENNRLLLFIIGTSYKHEPLHAIIQSASGSGKSHLINTIADCLPEEDLLSLSRISSKSLYHYKADALKNKLVVIQDFDGLDDEALFAFRELQSFGKLTSSVTGKDAFGNHSARLHTVLGHFASFGASTKEVYTDNASRSILLKIDESIDQTRTILEYVMPSNDEILSTKKELSNMIRLLKPRRIVNPFRSALTAPKHIPMARRLNNQLAQFVEQITFLHQYQRDVDEQGRIITTISDAEEGIELFAECLWMKTDELEPSTRLFYEKLKTYAQKQKQKQKQKQEHDGNKEGTESIVSFTQRELRHALHAPKTSLQRFIKSLMDLEYLEIVSGSTNKGFRYALQYTDDTKALKAELIQELRANLATHRDPKSLGHQSAHEHKQTA